MRRALPLLIGLLSGSLCLSSALARVPDAVPVGPGDVKPGPRATWMWVRKEDAVMRDLTDVAVLPGDRDTFAFATSDGSVWVSVHGLPYKRVRGPSLRSQEHFRADDAADALDRAADSASSVDPEDPETWSDAVTADDALDDASQRALDDAADAARGATSEATLFGDDGGDALPPRVWFTSDGLLLEGRDDGLAWSDDLGTSWHKALDFPVYSLLLGPDGWVAGGADGVRIADDPRDWVGARRALVGTHVVDLAVDWTGLHAATDRGWLRSEDGLSWDVAARGSYTAIVTDPASERVWLGSEDGVRAFDLDGQPVRALPSGPRGVNSLAMLAPGHLIACGSDGPEETLDDGASFAPIVSGLATRALGALVSISGQLWAAGPDGLFHLEPRGQPLARAPEWIPVETLVSAALRRPGIARGSLGNRMIAGMMPNVGVIAVWDPNLGRSGSAAGENTPPQNNGDEDKNWYVRVVAQWEYGRTRRDVDFDPYIDDQYADGTIASNVGFEVSRDERVWDVAREVRDVYHARQTLVLERGVLIDAALHEKVRLELDIQEAEARLDALTAGAVSSYKLSQPE